MYFYYQENGGEEKWKPIPIAHKDKLIRENNPTFITALAVNKLVEDLPSEDRLKLKYFGGFYVDFDSRDISIAIQKFNEFLDKLEALKFDLSMASLHLSGSKGMHILIPAECFMDKVDKTGVTALPSIYREMALDQYVDTLDLRVYSGGMGRMWRCPNKLRDNGKYKVGITLSEARELTIESYAALCSQPRAPLPIKQPQLCLDLALVYAKAAQKVDEKLKKRGKFKTDPNAKARAACASISLAMMGQGLKPEAGFQYIAMQLAIAATTAGTALEKFLEDCTGLIDTHEGNGLRYNTPGKRKAELERMFNYVYENPMYEFSIGAVKALLSHTAPDLDGIAVEAGDIQAGIAEAAAEVPLEGVPDEYSDVASGVTLSKFGIYIDTEFGKKRVCAISFTDTNILKNCEDGATLGYETGVLVNGKLVCRQDLSNDVFTTSLSFNRFCAAQGHAFTGTDMQLRGAFMRFVEQAKKKGGTRFLAKREGLDLVSLPNDADPDLKKPFLIWADNRGVLMEPRARATGLQMQFQGYPDPKGLFKTDLANAPKLGEWIKEGNNKSALISSMNSLMTCQTPEVLGGMIGWYTACFWRMLFNKVYDKFPLLHIAGQAGSGKSEMGLAMQSMFFYDREPMSLTPSSSSFSIQQTMAGSASIPLMLDEYKVETMQQGGRHATIKLILRDAYQCRDVTRGGGSRENSDYRSLSHSQLSAPLLFIAEAEEEESAVMERVVLLRFIRPHASIATRRYSLFQAFRRNKQHLAIIGQYIAAKILANESLESFRSRFDPMYSAARDMYMITENNEKENVTQDVLISRQNAKERSVFNYTVAKFGFTEFRAILNSATEFALDARMSVLENSIYDKMGELQKATQAEYLKVLSTFSIMTTAVEDGKPEALRKGYEYAFINLGGKDCIEINARSAYLKYKQFCRICNIPALFAGHEPFVMALRNSSALVFNGPGKALHAPNIFCFEESELARLGVEPFKA